jgi:hypothetical protein
MPLGKPSVTEKQFELLAWVYVAGYRSAADSHITWSPKALLKRSPTKTEAAVLSRRVKGLVDRGLLIRHGRELAITDTGKAELAIYSADRQDELLHQTLLARLDFDDAVYGLGFSQQLRPALIAVYRDELDIEHEDAVDAAQTLSMAFTRHSIKQAKRALERLQSAQAKMHEHTKREVSN